MSKHKQRKPSSASQEKTLLLARDALSKITSILDNDLTVLRGAEIDDAVDALHELIELFTPYESQLKQMEDQKLKLQKAKEETCKKEGHVGVWKEETRYEDIVIDHQFCKNFPYTVWYRRCTRCGAFEETQDKPKEIINQEKREEIKELQERIHQIKSELDE